MLGAMMSVLGALAVAFWFELRNPVVRSAAQMERELGYQPVVAVPFLDTRPKRRFFGLLQGRPAAAGRG